MNNLQVLTLATINIVLMIDYTTAPQQNIAKRRRLVRLQSSCTQDYGAVSIFGFDLFFFCANHKSLDSIG